MKRYFGLIDGEVEYVGSGEDISDVEDNPLAWKSVWLWSEDALRELITSAKKALNENL